MILEIPSRDHARSCEEVDIRRHYSTPSEAPYDTQHSERALEAVCEDGEDVLFRKRVVYAGEDNARIRITEQVLTVNSDNL